MEIKYTIEILTKDIQDIEKLLGKIGNSKDASSIEMDLALAKLRNVYEVLTIIKADRLHEMVTPAPAEETQPEMSTPTTELQSRPETEQEPVTEKETGQAAETEPEQVPEMEPEQVPEAEPRKVPEMEPEKVPEAEPGQVPEMEPEQVPEVEPEERPELLSEEKQAASNSILAEKFSAQASINENLAEKRGSDTEAKLRGQPIESISRNIGINDRFLIIRELFEGEAERFTTLVNELENAGNYEAARDILKQQFADQLDHEGVEILAGLLKRRYIR